MLYLIKSGGEPYEKVAVICLIAVQGGLVADGGTASIAAVNDDKALFGVGQSLYRAKDTAAIIGSVTGIDVHVE